MVRRNYSMIILILSIAWMQSACFVVDGMERREEISKTFGLKSGAKIFVHNVNGSIVVDAWDQEKVEVHATKTTHGYDVRDAEENLKKLEVIFDSHDNELRVEARYPRMIRFSGGVQFTLHVPRKVELDLQSTNGHVEAVDVQGQIRLGTTNGSLKAENVGGSLQGTTTNGKITATFTKFSGEGIRLSTTNGSIQLSLPDDIDAHLSAHTTNGNVRTDFPITTQGTFRRHSLEGTIGKGGATITLGTTNGSISILRSSRGTV